MLIHSSFTDACCLFDFSRHAPDYQISREEQRMRRRGRSRRTKKNLFAEILDEKEHGNIVDATTAAAAADAAAVTVNKNRSIKIETI